MKPTNFSQYISAFIKNYLSLERGYSPNTIESYKDSFVLIIKFIEQEKKIKLERITIETFTKDLILEFLYWLKTSRNSSDSTINNRLAAIHSFFKYLCREDLTYLNQCQSILSIYFKRHTKISINYLSPEAIKLLFSIPNLLRKKGRRDLALLSLLYDTGARVQEIIDLTPSMVNLHEPMTIKLIGKGRKTRINIVCKGQMEHLKIYMKENNLFNPNVNLEPLFYNLRKEKLTRAGVNHILKCYVKKAREIEPSLFPEKVSCHSLRHSKAMHLLRSGTNLVHIRDVLGHSSIITTEIYAKIDSKQKREAIEKAYINLSPTPEKSKWEDNPHLTEWLRSL